MKKLEVGGWKVKFGINSDVADVTRGQALVEPVVSIGWPKGRSCYLPVGTIVATKKMARTLASPSYSGISK